MRKLKNFSKSLLYRLFVAGQKLRFDILPRHYYSQVPDIKLLKTDDYWKQPMSMYQVAGSDIDTQAAFFKTVCTPELSNEAARRDVYGQACRINGEGGGYGEIEAIVLYDFIRTVKPKRIIQVGCGVSTAVMLEAAKDANIRLDIVCIEPYPTPFLRGLAAEGSVQLVEQKAQLVPMDIFTVLEEGDLLFVDSTHTVKAGSEVNRIIMEVLPRLKPGINVHFHDIYFPFDYTRNLLSGDLFFWLESTLLYAFLLNNNKYAISMSMSMLHYAAPGLIKERIPVYDPQGNDFGLTKAGGQHFPSSIYIKSKI